MFSGLKRILGTITAQEVGDTITVEGVDTRVMRGHIKARFQTSRIESMMFTRFTPSSFSFPSFFAPDVLHAMQLMGNLRGLQMPVRTIDKICKALLENTWLKSLNEPYYSRLDYDKLANFHYKPLPHQSEFWKEYDRITAQYQLKGWLLAASAGAGKTLTSIALMEMLDHEHVFVVCPNNALDDVWRSSLQTLMKTTPTHWVSKDGKPYNNEKYIVGSYQALPELVEIAKRLQGRTVGVILDESHNLNDLKSLRTSLFLDLCVESDAMDIVWQSGTPIKAIATEAIPLLRCLDRRFTPDVEHRFRKIFSSSKGRAVDILQIRMGYMAFFVEKKVLNLPPPIFLNLPVRFPGAEKYALPAVKEEMRKFIAERSVYYQSRAKEDKALFDQGLQYHEATLDATGKERFKEYQHALKLVIRSGGDWAYAQEMKFCNQYELKSIYPILPKEWRAEWKGVRALVKYPALKIQGECLGRIFGGLRQECHVEMAKHIDFHAVCESSKKKTLVFTSFVSVIDACEEAYEKQGLKSLHVSAKTNKSLSEILAKFTNDPSYNPLTATYASLSTAVPVLAADTVLMIDSPWRDYMLQQTVSRVHRLGQDSQVYVYAAQLDTGSEPNLSSRSLDVLKWSQQSIEEITGVTSPFVIKDGIEEFDAALEDYQTSPGAAEPKYNQW